MKKVLLIILVAVLTIPAFTQSDDNDESDINLGSRTGIYFTPQYLIMNGIRLDIEHQFKDSRSAIVFAPHIYLRKKDQYTGIYDYNEMLGLGLWVDYKYYLTDKRVTYISAGPNYLYNMTKYEDQFGWDVVGNEIHEVKQDRQQTIHRIGMNTTIGFNFELYEKIRIDLFGGFGLRYAIVDTDLSEVRMDEYIIDPAYHGTILLAGIKVGLNVKD